jgi:lipoprotein-anchoring transpeptidase ErfK/SrfK
MNNNTRTKILLAAVVVVVLLGVGWLLLRNTSILKHTPGTVIPIVEIPIPEKPFGYIEIMGGCGPYYTTGICVNVRSGPGTEHSVVARLRTGVVLKVEPVTIADDQPETANGRRWYKVTFNKTLAYPERVAGGWYVAVNPSSIRQFADPGDSTLEPGVKTTTKKRIVVQLSKQMLYAYDGDKLFMQEPVSTGLELTGTPLGTFRVFTKTPSRFMQGPIRGVSDQVYDLPGVPWDLYFTSGGAVIHGAYWHDNFGQQWSHGCVNLPSQQAKKLYEWADLGTPVIIEE